MRKRSTTSCSIGDRIKKARSKSKLKEDALGYGVGVSQSMISRYESGYPVPPELLPLLAAQLRVSVSWLVAGVGPDDASQDVGVWDLKSQFTTRVRNILGEPYELGGRVRSINDELVNVCAEFLVMLEDLRIGADMTIARQLCDGIVRILEPSQEHIGIYAKRLLFRACNKAIHLMSFVLPTSDLLLQSVHYKDLMNELLVDMPDLRSTYWGRIGDLSMVLGRESPEIAHRAIRHFELAGALGSERYKPQKNIGYHCIRDPIIVMSQISCSDQKFRDLAVRTCHASREIQWLTPHQRIHILEGVADAYCQRFKITGSRAYADDALALMDLLSAKQKGIEEESGAHSEMWLRIERLAIQAYECGIEEHLKKGGEPSKSVAFRAARDLQARAKHTGSKRIESRMRDVCARFERTKAK